VHNLPNPILDNNLLISTNIEPSLSDEHTVLEFLVALVAGLREGVSQSLVHIGASPFLPVLQVLGRGIHLEGKMDDCRDVSIHISFNPKQEEERIEGSD
jgi:hypothetical protein